MAHRLGRSAQLFVLRATARPTQPALSPSLTVRDGCLELDGVALERLATQLGTPFFLLSERRLLANYHALADGFAAAGVAVTLRYCAKTNHEAGVLAPLARAGSALLASHQGEVELGLACGFSPRQIAFQRPVVSDAELAAVVGHGVGLVHAQRAADLDRLAAAVAAARRRGATVERVAVSLRLRDDGGGSLAPLAAAHRRSGFTSGEALAAATRWQASDELVISGLNVYVGTQQPDLRVFERAFRRCCQLARAFEEGPRVQLSEINLGGGIPSPTLRKIGLRQLIARWLDRPRTVAAAGGQDADARQDPAVASLEQFASRLGASYRRAAAAAGLVRVPTLAAEPGRSIVGNAMVLVAKVAAVAPGWLFLDTSRNVLGESPLLFTRQILPLLACDGPRRFFNLSGSTLNTTDVLDLHRRLPPLAVGDGLLFCDAGAYSISRATRYGGLTPAAYAITPTGEVRTIRRPEAVADLLGPMAPAFDGPAAGSA